MIKLVFILYLFLFLTISCNQKEDQPELDKLIIEYGTVLDIDGNLYKTVKIGKQWWMAENLKVTKYRNGDPIPNISINSEWQNNSTGAYCNYNNDPSIGNKSGRLYNWQAVREERKLAPSGWHIPSRDEWKTLIDYLSNNGGCLAESMGWKSDEVENSSIKNNKCYNSSGFNAIKCGYRQANGLFVNERSYSNWWSSTYFGDGLVWCRHINADDGGIFDAMQSAKYGFSVRCVKDSVLLADIPSVITTQASFVTATSASAGGNVSRDNGAPIISRGICWSEKNKVPNLNDNKTNDGDGIGTFTSSINNLRGCNIYYYRAFATNREGTGYGSVMAFKTMRDSIIKDIDGNIYTTVIIGTQEWMVENLKTTRYRDGKYIYENNNINYCWYNNDSIFKEKYGALYSWEAVGSKKLSPEGWHIPSNDEWTKLITYLGGENVAGAKLKDAGLIHWQRDNKESTNETGFTALPGGYRIGDFDRKFASFGYGGYWWSSTRGNPSVTNYAWYRSMSYSDGKVNNNHMTTYSMLSVRCLRD